MFRTANPALNNPAYQEAPQSWNDLDRQGGLKQAAVAQPGAMTLQGTVNKSALLIAICAAVAIPAWGLTENNTVPPIAGVLGASILGFIIFLVTSFNPKMAPVTAPIYAACEGFFVGAISALYAKYTGPGAGAASGGGGPVALNTELVFNAGLLTFGIFGGLLAAYSFKLIRPNALFYNIIIVGTLGACLYAVIALVAGLFGSFDMLSVYDPNNGGLISIGFSLLLVALASGNLILDFDTINNGVKNGAPKHMEWFSGMALLVTLVWLYVEVLRLLAKLQSRD